MWEPAVQTYSSSMMLWQNQFNEKKVLRASFGKGHAHSGSHREERGEDKHIIHRVAIVLRQPKQIPSCEVARICATTKRFPSAP